LDALATQDAHARSDAGDAQVQHLPDVSQLTTYGGTDLVVSAGG